MLTKHFPFNDGGTPAESYLETEIKFIAPHFASVVIVATEASSSAVQIQNTPENVISLALGFPQTLIEKCFCLIEGLFSLRLKQIAADAVKTDSLFSVDQHLFQRYYVGKAFRKWKALKGQLEIREIIPTNVYSFWFHDTALIACWLKQKYSCQSAIARAHRYDLYHDRTRCNYLPCRYYQLSCLDTVIPCSEDGTLYLKKTYPAFTEKIRTGYLGTCWLPDMSSENRGASFKIVSCSAVTDVKRVSLLAKALMLLDARGFEIEWTHYGDGPKLAEVKEIAKHFNKISSCFVGNIANKQLLREYRENHFDLFINVSASEGLPISIMEASGHGIPVLATDVGGTHEIVSDGFNGMLIPEQSSAEDIAASILQFLNMNDEDYSLMRAAARKQWKTKFQTNCNAQILIDALFSPQISLDGESK